MRIAVEKFRVALVFIFYGLLWWSKEQESEKNRLKARVRNQNKRRTTTADCDSVPSYPATYLNNDFVSKYFLLLKPWWPRLSDHQDLCELLSLLLMHAIACHSSMYDWNKCRLMFPPGIFKIKLWTPCSCLRAWCNLHSGILQRIFSKRKQTHFLLW